MFNIAEVFKLRLVITKREMVVSGIIYLAAAIILCVLCNNINNSSVFFHNIEIWVNACRYIDFFLPVFAPLIFATALYYRRKDGFLNYLSARISKKKYIFEYIGLAMTVTVVFTTVMYYAGILYSIQALRINVISGDDYFYNNVFGHLQAESPLTFGLLWCVWKGVIASLFTGFGCILALYIDNIFVVIITPFIYVMAENLITGLLGIPEYGIFTSLDFDRLSPEGMHVYNYFCGVVIFLAVAIFIVLVARFKSRRMYATS